MELGKQIKKYRNELSWSQDDLAERIYVSRQTISNWENDKSYPDVNSLVLLSEVFHTSIDNLIKGDVEMMKEEIGKEDRRKFEKLSYVYLTMLLLMIFTPIPLVLYWSYAGFGLWVILASISMYVASLVEKQKKKYDIQTFREIMAFMEGKKLDEIAKVREEGKRPYQKVMYALGAGGLALVVSMILLLLLK